MTNNTTTNETLETVSESGILDSLADNPELALLGVLVAALGAYAAYTIPAVRTFALVYLNKFMNKYDTQIMELLDKHLSKAQRKAFGFDPSSAIQMGGCRAYSIVSAARNP